MTQKEQMKKIRDCIRELKYKARRRHQALPDVKITAWNAKLGIVAVKFNDNSGVYTLLGTNDVLEHILNEVCFRFSLALLDTMHATIKRTWVKS